MTSNRLVIWGEAQSIWGLRPKIWSEYVYCVHCVEYPMDTTQRRFDWDVYYVDIRAFKGCNKRKLYLAEMRWLSHRIKKFGESKEKAWFLKRLKSYSFSWEDLNQSFKYDIWNLALFWRRRDYLTSRLSDQAILMEGISYYYDGPFFLTVVTSPNLTSHRLPEQLRIQVPLSEYPKWKCYQFSWFALCWNRSQKLHRNLMAFHCIRISREK